MLAVIGGNYMGQDARSEALKAKHAEIEHILTEEERRPFPDFAMVQELEKRKLRVKDELQRVSHLPDAHSFLPQ